MIKNTLSPSINNISFEAIRDGFGRGLLKVAQTNRNIVALSGDLSESIKMDEFKNKYPERYFECGVAEQNMLGIGAGLALSGKIPFVGSYAVFNPGRNWDQLRVSVCYTSANVKIVGAHAGLSVGADGATHQALEDIAITRVLPNLIVLVPADSVQAELATIEATNHHGPVYLRLERPKTAIMTSSNMDFKIGKAQIWRSGNDVVIFACGSIIYEAMRTAEELKKKKISVEVINIHTIKPLDEKTILKSVQKTKLAITLEEHQIIGGMGSAVAELISEKMPKKLIRLGVNNQFGESGNPQELLEKYKLTTQNIVKTILNNFKK